MTTIIENRHEENVARVVYGLAHAITTGMLYSLIAIVSYYYGWDFVPLLIGTHVGRSYLIGWEYKNRKIKESK